MSKIKEKLDLLVERRNLIPDEFWVDGAFWFHSAETGGYEWSAERLGIKRNGDIAWAFDSGCSCNSSWESFNLNECPTKSHKEFVLQDFLNPSKDEYCSDEIGTTEESLEKGIDEFLLIVRDDVAPNEVLSAQNAEIRRYLIKRIGYDKIKEFVQAKILHRDVDNELIQFANGEMYVKVKDSSTDREYLLFVEGGHKTCRSAIAWTFGLREEEYQPIIET